MSQQQSREYAELVEKMAALLVASYGPDEDWVDRIDMVKEDLEVAVEDAIG